jgi:hypothetical protein
MVSGEIVWANLVNGIENRCAGGKERPVIIVEVPESGCLRVIGLTSKGVGKCGVERIAVSLAGCARRPRARSYVFGRRLSRIARHDIYEHIGWIDDETKEMLEFELGITFDGPSNSAVEVGR